MKRTKTKPSAMESSVDGIRYIVEPSNALPLVDIVLAIRGGATLDPVGKEGLSRLVVRTLRMGPKGLEGHEVEEKLAAVWAEVIDHDFRLPPEKPLTLVAYAAGPVKTAYIEPVATGEVLPDMPLFLEPDLYVPVPLEATYRAAFDAVPRRWRWLSASPSSALNWPPREPPPPPSRPPA